MRIISFCKSLNYPGIKQLFVILTVISIFYSKASASNYYWIGGSGNWDELSHWSITSGGTTLYTEIPTALDDVFFDANSFTAPGQTVHLNPLTIFVHDMIWTGVTNNPTMAAPGSNTLKLYGSLVFAAGMNMNFGGPIYFESTTPGQIITTAGKSFLSSIIFNGIGGEWTLQDNLTCVSGLLLNAGTLNTNDRSVTIALFESAPTSQNPRALNMGASIFTLTFTEGLSWWINGGYQFNINCGTSVINMRSGSFNGGGFAYYDLNFTDTSNNVEGSAGAESFHDVFFGSHAKISGNCHDVTIKRDGQLYKSSFNNLTLTAGRVYSIGNSVTPDTITVNGVLSANGTCNALIEIHSTVEGQQATIIHAPGVVTVSYLVLKDLNVTGGATFTASNCVDLGDNTGWNFTSSGPQNLYWIGNGGNWSDGNHWSHTSGGVPSGCSPTPADNVFFDANSFTTGLQVVSINPVVAYCRNMDWTGVTNNPSVGGPLPTFLNELKIYGSLTLASGMIWGFPEQLSFEAVSTSETITMSGQSLNGYVYFNGAGSTWTLQDDFNGGSIMLNAGTFTTNNKTVNIVSFSAMSPTACKLNMGTSIFNVQGWEINNSPIVVSCGTSVINLSGSSFGGGSRSYYDLNATAFACSVDGSNSFHDAVFSGRLTLPYGSTNFHNAIIYGDGTLYGSNSFNDLTISAGHSYELSGPISINGTLSANGSCGAYIDIHSQTPGTQALIFKSSGTVNASRLILKDIRAEGGAIFNAANSTDLGNSSGWNITPTGTQDFYWVGNAGNWNDGNHWSYSSGGAPSGCSPTPLNNVIFDSNSFSLPDQAVIMNNQVAYCRNMTWAGVTNFPKLLDAPGFLQLKIYGSLTLSQNMTMFFSGLVYFEATTSGQTITTAGKTFTTIVIFNGIGGGWIFEDTFTSTWFIALNNGTLNTNNQTVNIHGFGSTLPHVRALNLGSSIINLTGDFSSNDDPWDIENDFPDLMTINTGTSVINLPNGTFLAGYGHSYYDVNFTNNTGPSGSISGYGNHFHNVVFANQQAYLAYHPDSVFVFNSLTFHGNANINGDNNFNDLNFTAGYTYNIKYNSTQTITDHWRIQGSCTAYILLQSDIQGQPASFVKPAGDVNGYNIHIKDIHCSGGANFIAYNSVDLGGNQGWNFSILPPLNNPNPISGPTTVCAGSSSAVVYHIPPVLGAISYEWSVPQGAVIVSGQGDTTIVVNFDTAFSGDIVVQSFNGCNYGTISSALSVIVLSQPDPAVSITADTLGPVCPGTPITFTATATNTGGSAPTFDFTVNGISIQSGSSNIFTTTNLNNADYVGCVVTVAGNACFGPASAISDTLSVIVNTGSVPDPVVTIAANPAGQLCAGTPVTFTAVVTGAGSSNITYDFKVNGISIQTSASNSFTVSTLSNNDVIACEITLSAGTCFTSGTATSSEIVVNINTDTAPDPHVSITSNASGQICLNTPVTFTAALTGAGSGSVSYDFKINGISAQSSSLNVFTTTALLNTDQVSCAVLVSAAACFASTTALSDTIVMNVNTDTPPNPHVTISANPAGKICAGKAVTFTAIVTGTGSSIITYNFNVNGTIVQSNNSNTYITSVLTNNDAVSCNINLPATQCFGPVPATSNTILEVVNSATAPDPHVLLSVSPAGELCPDAPLKFMASATGTGNNAVEYDFKVNGNSLQHGSSNIFEMHTLRRDDVISCGISVIGGDCFAATSAKSNSFVIDGRSCDGCDLSIPNAISPNGDGMNDRWIISNSTCFRQVNVFVYNRYGSLIYQKDNYQNGWEGRYKSQPLPDGTYYYVVRAIKTDGHEQVFKGNVTILR